jgi:hypothetical protein
MAWLDLLVILVLGTAYGAVVNLDNGQTVNYTWIETGSTAVGSVEFITISTVKTSWTNPIVFISSPKYTGSEPDTQPYSSRINIVNDGGDFKFELKLYEPTGEECTNEWNTPTNTTSDYTVGWMVAEAGGYLINDVDQFVITSYEVSAAVTKLTWPHKFGTTCNKDDDSGDDRAPGAIFTIQTLVNHRYLITRTNPLWFKTYGSCSYAWQVGRVFLQGHDTLDTLSTIQPETVGVFLFDFVVPHSVDCLGLSSLVEFGASYSSQPLSTQTATSTGVTGIFIGVLTYNGGDNIAPKVYSEESDSETFYVKLQVSNSLLHYSFSFST